MNASDLQEQLLRLYLRLNGFFTSGFIVHSAEGGKNKTEVDTIAVRFPHNREPEREVECDKWLDLSGEHIELALCEVKTREVRFNDAFYSDIEAIRAVLRWAGMFTEDQLRTVTPQVQTILRPELVPTPVIRRVGPFRGVVVRTLLFCPGRRQPRRNQSWFVGSDHVFPFITDCLSPASIRTTCSTNYGAGQWAEHSDLVGFFKDWSHARPPTFDNLKHQFGVE